VLTSVARTGLAAERAVPARRGAGPDRARAEAERFTGTKRAPGPKLTAEVVARSLSDDVVTPGMSAWDGAEDGVDEGRGAVGGDVAARAERRFLAGAGCALRVAAGRGELADAGAADLSAGSLLPVALG
jgi:hypothetical protein